MTGTEIVGGRVVSVDRVGPATIELSGDTIGRPGPAARHAFTIDARGLTVCPGFIDLQINGGFGLDLATDPEAIWDLGRQLPRYGVTAFLPTIISSPPAVTDRAIEALRRRPVDYVGAEPLGLHLEGPMLSPARPGAHPVERLRAPGPDVIERWSADAGVAMVTIAPELPNALAIVAELVDRGVVVAAGHSEPTASEVQAGLGAGITAVTHLFNAMAQLGHRAPGLIGVALAEPSLTAGLIVDGVHVDPIVVRAAWNAKGPHAIALVTDGVAPTGLGPGRYGLGPVEVEAGEHSVRNLDGTLAGSLLTMDRAVKNIIAFTGCPLQDAITAATATPANVIGEARRGRLERDGIADVTLLDDQLDVVLTICGGRIAFVAASANDRITHHPGAR